MGAGRGLEMPHPERMLDRETIVAALTHFPSAWARVR